jgi:CRISPR-associated protein Cas1
MVPAPLPTPEQDRSAIAPRDDRSELAGELVPAAMLRKYAYCPRLFHLEWIQQEWRDTDDTVRGQTVHRRVDEEAGSLPEPTELDPEDRIAARAVLLSAPRLGLIAKLDLLEGEGGRVRPVDYKKGSPGPHGPWEPERGQLCAQGAHPAGKRVPLR